MPEQRIIYPKQVPIIFSDPIKREQAERAAWRRLDMINAGTLHTFGKDHAQGKVDLAELDKDQLDALAQESLAAWCVAVEPTVDSKQFSFDDRRYLVPVYADDSQEKVIMKGAQCGASTLMLLDNIHLLQRYKMNAGIYLPTEALIGITSKNRLDPILIENPKFVPDSANNAKSVRLKTVGKGSLLMLHMGSKVARDSVPLDAISIDEVRLMEPADVSQALERIAGSKRKIIRYYSTPGYPGSDIAKLFDMSTQAHWHCKCGCPDGVNLPAIFPNCIAIHKGRTFFFCPKCKYEIKDPQNGFYIEYNPGHWRKGYAFSQLTSPTQTAQSIWRKYNETDNIKEFHNACLGRPYIDEENISITQQELDRCVNTDTQWGKKFKHTYMGVDQMDGLNVVTILGVNIDGKKQIVHLEWVDTKNPKYRNMDSTPSPFERLYTLMRVYNVKHCLIDQLPNTNEALRFAQAFPGRVFLTLYSQTANTICSWTDKDKASVRRSSDKIKYPYRCILNRYQSIEYMFSLWKRQQFVVPPPRALTQEVRNSKGEFEPTFVGDLYFKHLKSIVREKHITNEETGTFRMRWVHVGIDPHWVHATNLAVFASERSAGYRSLDI